MNRAGFLALDHGCRGAAAVLLVMIAAVLLRDRPATSVTRISAALAGAGAASAIIEAPGFPAEWHWWSLPLIMLSSSGSIAFWLWARAVFDDDFIFRPWHGVVWSVLVGLNLAVSCRAVADPIAAALDRALTFSNLGLAMLAVAQTLATWRADLVARRRRLRAAVLIGIFGYIAVNAAVNLSFLAALPWPFWARSFSNALGLCLLAVLAGWDLFRAAASDQALMPAPAVSSIGQGSFAPVKNHSRPLIEPVLLNRLQHLMTVERTYRHEGITIGSLAVLMNLPEYRLRQIINEGLGHRNFNTFLNRYRIDEAKDGLADASQKDVPILTIAMDAGFQSLGPFNRAFKVDTGLTPTEFRRLALAKSPSKPPSEERNLDIG